MRKTFRNTDGPGVLRHCQHCALRILGLAEIQGWRRCQQGLADQFVGKVLSGGMDPEDGGLEMLGGSCCSESLDFG